MKKKVGTICIALGLALLIGALSLFIYNQAEAKKAEESAEKIQAEFAKVLPEYDRDRVHVSDMKKCFAWYNILVQAGFTEFKLPEAAEGEEAAEE